MAFADVGDRLTMSVAPSLSLTVIGPFGATLDGQGDNLILKALRALGREAGIGDPPLAVILDKRLPIAAGLGGGSSDAGTALRLADTVLELDLGDDRLAEISRIVGADGPMCFAARTAWASGIGDDLVWEPNLPPLHAVLVNPGRPSPTGAVYRAYDQGGVRADDRPSPPVSWDAVTVIDWLAQQRNDLEPPAIALEPEIESASLAVGRAGARLTRMSGSGATVFGLFEDAVSARAAAEVIRRAHPDWWVEAAILSADKA